MMETTTSDAEVTIPRVLRETLARDGWARGGIVVFAVVGLVFLLPVLTSTTRAKLSGSYVYPFFVVLALAALAIDLRKVPRPEERRFWLDLLVAHVGWVLTFLPLSWSTSPLTQSLITDACYGVFYLALILAVERRVHLRIDWRPTAFERLLTWPGVLIYVVGQLLYFVVIPMQVNPSAYLSGIPSIYLFLSFDLYLTCTFWYLARSARSRRWQVLYGLLTTAMVSMLIGDLLERLRHTRTYGWEWGTPFDFLWTLPLLLMALAARARHYRFPARDQAEARRPESNLSGPAGRTMVMALAFPLFHFLGYGTNLLDPITQPQREQLVLGMLVLLGVVALGQQRLLSRRVESILEDREKFEEDLRSSEQDLRFMVERLHAEERLRHAERKFFEAFRASPDVMAISSLEDGRLMEVNRSFETLIGYQQDEVVGKTVEALGLWAHPEERKAMARQLRQGGRIADLEAAFRRKSGELGSALFSAEPITIDGEPCLLSVTHDVTEFRQAEESLADETRRLTDFPKALLVFCEQRAVFANRQAIALSQWDADALEGRPLSELFPDLDDDPLDGSSGAQTLHLKLATPGTPLDVVTRWWRREGPKGAQGWTLVLLHPHPTTP